MMGRGGAWIRIRRGQAVRSDRSRGNSDACCTAGRPAGSTTIRTGATTKGAKADRRLPPVANVHLSAWTRDSRRGHLRRTWVDGRGCTCSATRERRDGSGGTSANGEGKRTHGRRPVPRGHWRAGEGQYVREMAKKSVEFPKSTRFELVCEACGKRSRAHATATGSAARSRWRGRVNA